jgi:predicted ATPase
MKKPPRFTHLHLDNWRNFVRADVALENRVFLVGPNASGKSNLLDVFRFLRDVAAVGGGFQRAVQQPGRGGVAKLKSLAAPHAADVGIRVTVGTDRSPRRWEYELRFSQEQALPQITKERVVKQGKELLRRPTPEDNKDPLRLIQTSLEQVNANREFRELADFFASVRYVHMVPQTLRGLVYSTGSQDPFGGDILRQMAELPEGEREERVRLMRDTLRAAVPQFKLLEYWFDTVQHRPHLRAQYEHLEGTWQLEDQFSDGTLRMIGLVWALLDGRGPLLLEEPELSLHPRLIRSLPFLFYGLQQRSGRQVMISTHSADLLHEEGIGLNEVVVLQPRPDGTAVSLAADDRQTRVLVNSGLPLDDAIVPKTAPRGALDLALVGA